MPSSPWRRSCAWKDVYKRQVVDGSQAAEAVRCLHTAFDLDSDSVFEETQLSAEEIAAKMNKGR